ncbi:helix-turn-helix transcriptional regulator [Anaeromicropila herbilytica]|uniref:Transcriptional regulator n=1 Tax=Anaeromicropila herbilytica TaxID=2785025 RepID=A0A7R7EL71_9FIRM|nr:WYL domain-containing protein [Anaeromicropila herbilytica]BCN30808.1 transcriptional regulator [Anaeromicropila herbilytica]
MKIERLLGLTIYLLNHGRTSANILAKHFEVSTRTIVRDIDTLCLAGIPVVSNCGVDGGYEIMETFKMQQQIADEIDYNYVICALQGLASAYANRDIEATLEKMQYLSPNSDNTIFMDLSVVHENRDTNEMLFILNQCIQKKHRITFSYTNSNDENKEVEVEPVATIYKWYNWYLIGYSVKYHDYRMYKVIRMDHLRSLDKENTRIHNLGEVNAILKDSPDHRKRITIQLLCKANLISRCREYLNGTVTKEYENGDFEYEIVVPENEQFWYGVILSFGKDAKVLAPVELINRIIEDYEGIMQMYHE